MMALCGIPGRGLRSEKKMRYVESTESHFIELEKKDFTVT